jgi:hypothetical protein
VLLGHQLLTAEGEHRLSLACEERAGCLNRCAGRRSQERRAQNLHSWWLGFGDAIEEKSHILSTIPLSKGDGKKENQAVGEGVRSHRTR